jgi:type I restriction enzyme S subunit
LNPKYVSYLFQTDRFLAHKKKYATGTKVIRMSDDNMGKFVVPVPPREEQDRIVSILDNFEALNNSLTDGLPAEIKARQQQYEYYRDKLLTFKRAS